MSDPGPQFGSLHPHGAVTNNPRGRMRPTNTYCRYSEETRSDHHERQLALWRANDVTGKVENVQGLSFGLHCFQVRDMSKKQQALERDSSWQRRKVKSRNVLRKKGTSGLFITFCKPEVEYLQRDLFHWQSWRLSLQAAVLALARVLLILLLHGKE